MNKKIYANVNSYYGGIFVEKNEEGKCFIEIADGTQNNYNRSEISEEFYNAFVKEFQNKE